MTAIKRVAFFDHVRDMYGDSLNQDQVDGIDNILDEWQKRGLSDIRHLAYMLATTKHETAATMQPIREKGSERYLKSKPYYPWVGEGLVQVTWRVNHVKFGATEPGQLLKWPDCLSPLFDGMLKGMFTGKKLSDYFNDKKDDPLDARRIINGMDRAQLVANYHKDFLSALKA